jgi:hypothetical protein
MERSATNALFAIRNLATLLAERSEDTATLRTIIDFTNDRGRWPKAHGLFDQIRSKTSKALLRGDEKLEAQYRFEEVCVKTLYNLGRYSAPFDPDSPYWIIPNALRAGELLGFTTSEILDQIKLDDETSESTRNTQEAEQVVRGNGV